jgi:hypothetical protein
LFGVLSSLLPHPSELVSKTVDEFEITEPEGEDGNGEIE